MAIQDGHVFPDILWRQTGIAMTTWCIQKRRPRRAPFARCSRGYIDQVSNLPSLQPPMTAVYRATTTREAIVRRCKVVVRSEYFVQNIRRARWHLKQPVDNLA